MNLAKGEYTTKGFIEYLVEKYGTKIGGKPFTTNDVAQYLIRGYTPYRYGAIKISSKVQDGIRLITVKEDKKKNK